ncbi:hypothetical protein QBC44DRAFT_372374 [Cladorrhinum sp. PSN332]|nr:hypothetical protein QBC44DRAFT_372374 [Cladorrhinum sp. PSN332]
MGLPLYTPGLYTVDPKTGRTIINDPQGQTELDAGTSSTSRQPDARQEPFLRIYPVPYEDPALSGSSATFRGARVATAAFGHDILHLWRQADPNPGPFIVEFRRLNTSRHIEAIVNAQGADQLIQRLNPSERVNALIVVFRPVDGPRDIYRRLLRYVDLLEVMIPNRDLTAMPQLHAAAVLSRVETARRAGQSGIFLFFIDRISPQTHESEQSLGLLQSDMA